ncbi:NAD(P)-binding domain-containing protein [soil metagenome]
MRADSPVTTVGILGAGKVGTVLARLSIAAGYRTLISASADPSAIELIVDVLAPGATAMTSADVAADAELVILALPLGKYRTLPVAELAGKVVVDSTNYWTPTDGVIDQFENDLDSSSILAAFLPRSRVVKAFNHLGYHQLDEDGRPTGAPDRHAMAIAGDHAEALQVVSDFVDSLGFDAVVAGPLASGIHFGPGSALFGVSAPRAEVEHLLSLARTT